MEVSKTEAAVIEIATKRLEEKGQATGLAAVLSLNPSEIYLGVGFMEAISPIDEDWMVVDNAIDPVSQLAFSNYQYKLRAEPQDAPPLGRTSPGAGEPRPRSFLLDIMDFTLASSPTRCTDPIVQAHPAAAQHLSLLSKHVGSGGTDQREVGELFPFASPKLTATVLC
jgi:hypothetical protein